MEGFGRFASRRARRVAGVAVLIFAMLVPGLVSAVASAAPVAGQSLDMKVLVISADGSETDYPAITAALDRVGVPYDKIVATQTPLTAAMLSDTATHGRYYAIVLTTGNLVYYNAATNNWPSALTPAQWDILHAYQTKFGVRSVTSYTFPEAVYGMSYAGYQDTLTTPLNGTLTAAGQTVFSYMNAANPLKFTGAWVYFGTITNPATTTPLMTTTVNGQIYALASVTQFNNYENLAITAANNPYLTHSQVLSYGWINWVTRGAFVGSRHTNWDIQIDDLFIDDDLWNPNTLTAGSQTYRNSATDITSLVAWEQAKRLQANTPTMKVDFPFVGVGSTPGEYTPDNLTPAIQANKSWFNFINHTFDHFNLDCGFCGDPTGTITTTASQIQGEITSNITQGQQLGLTSDWDTMVQPDISGINTPPNPMAQQAAANAGIRYWISDTSRTGQNNPSFNVGFTLPGDARLYAVPRHPTNLFYDASTQAQWVSLYNYFYGPGGTLCGITTCFTTKQTYAQIVDSESNWLLGYLLTGDLDPIMFHTPNVRFQNGHSLLTDLLDATLTKYNALVKVPIRNLTLKQAGQAMQQRGAFNAAGVTATYNACSSLTLHANSAALVPVTGVSYTAANSTIEAYAGQTISNVSLSAGQTVTIPLTKCL